MTIRVLPCNAESGTQGVIYIYIYIPLLGLGEAPGITAGVQHFRVAASVSALFLAMPPASAAAASRLCFRLAKSVAKLCFYGISRLPDGTLKL